MSPLRIVVDENLWITPSLEALGATIVSLPGREISARDVRDADVLLVRSVTHVDRALLANSRVRFVGTATAGTEHLDIEALASLGISWAAAPGNNAIAVAEYTLTAVAACQRLDGLMAGEGGIGIVGYGHVGRALTQRVQALGVDVKVFDPWVEVPKDVASDLSTVMAQSVVSLHAALHEREPWPSRGLISTELAREVRPGQLVINAGRGALIPREALTMMAQRGVTLVLDTWPREPHIDRELLDHCAFATPHIAGYSADAKARATHQLVSALTAVLELTPPAVEPFIEDGQRTESETGLPPVCIDAESLGGEGQAGSSKSACLEKLLLSHYSIADDDRRLRSMACPDVSGSDFDALRRSYPLRRELAGATVRVPKIDLAHYTALSRALAFDLLAV